MLLLGTQHLTLPHPPSVCRSFLVGGEGRFFSTVALVVPEGMGKAPRQIGSAAVQKREEPIMGEHLLLIAALVGERVEEERRTGGGLASYTSTTAPSIWFSMTNPQGIKKRKTGERMSPAGIRATEKRTLRELC